MKGDFYEIWVYLSTKNLAAGACSGNGILFDISDPLNPQRIDAVLDTTEPELLPEDSPLYDLDNVFLTPHIAGSQGAETTRMFALALDELDRFVAGAPLEHEVRREELGHIA